MSNEEDIVRKVQALWAKADDKAATSAEREAFTEKAKELMAKHAIDELVLAEAKGVDEEVILADILLYQDGNADKTLVSDQRMKLAHFIASHNRTKGIITDKPASLREDGTVQLAGKYMTLIGFRSDVNMVRLMYRSLGIDMIGHGTFDLEEADEQRAEMGEKPMTKAERKNYLINFCDGYADRIDRRLAEVEAAVEKAVESDGSLLPVLMSRLDLVDKRVSEMFPNLKTVRQRRFTVDPNARARGVKAANNANLGTAKGVGGSRKELT